MNKTGYRVPGFKASSVAAGLRKVNSPDMILIVSEKEAAVAGVFTTNRVKAAPVLLNMERIKKGRARAIIANAGNANACTGDKGLENARLTTEVAARELGIRPEEILVASTGVIGAQLDMDKMTRAIPDLVKGLSSDGIVAAAEAIMTTDSFSKISRFEGKAQGTPYRILGIAKGAGMIMPNMATMLCFILSDISIRPSQLKRALVSSVGKTFNRITVDGDTSTNDTVLILANGMAGNSQLRTKDYEEFNSGLRQVMAELSTMIVKDGEGATKLVHVKVKGAATGKEAITAARAVSNSSLVKTAFYGQDPNWGRIMAALGRSQIRLKEEEVAIWVDDIKIVERGLSAGAEQEKRAAERMKNREFSITIDMGMGEYEDQFTTCDLTHDYISINADYRT
ncbi:MAG TPA: bifunctional glutamate N-acetyltransferase/amino-acid acetyltransferase ArgJ [Desulfatiglandales bacterium]|nr:bifunctional glutamate N-acetyltransferase/amino-acid acetyltransferase ArgJ [Desulfatiglandales bacterium]